MPNKLTYSSGVDFAQLENEDSKNAQARFQSALSSGYDEDTAANLYLAPIAEKWKIIKSNPNEFQDPNKLSKINEDFDQATASAVKNIQRDQPASEAISLRVNPLLQSWSSIGIKPALNPTAQLHLKGLNSEILREEGQLNHYETAAKLAEIQGDDRAQAGWQNAADALRQKIAGMKSQSDAILLGQKPPQNATRLDSIPAANALSQSGIPEPSNGMANIPRETMNKLINQNANPRVTASQSLSKKPLIFISGSPLSNVTREEADKAWSKRFSPQNANPNRSTRSSLTRELAVEYLKRANGDKDKARQMAAEDGYDF